MIEHSPIALNMFPFMSIGVSSLLCLNSGKYDW